ncbi:transposase [Archangium violaceum]|uniref:IS701 family transposase n=1 Tax=Archangium violaceum TaxID=83451 RepID=UPI00193BC585|nr:transposase [Archangium violaceum]QRK08443.1 transposase [Archangium violaceum]
MTAPSINTLLPLLLLLRPVFTQPSFCRFLTLFAGWVSTRGVHAVTESLVNAGVSGVHHHAAFHRFFSRARWSLDQVGRLLLLRLVALTPGPLLLALDDTLSTHKGPKVFGLGVHLDPVRSTRRRGVLAFGHVWVVLTVLVPVPFSARLWALPVLMRLYRTQADCQKSGDNHLTKTQLARLLVEQVSRWLPDKPMELVADSAYACREVLRHLPQGVVFVGAMRADASLHRPRMRKCRSPVTGRPLTKDIPLPKPEKLARDKKLPWLSMTLTLYGKPTQVQYKELVARWSRPSGKTLLKIVIVKELRGELPLRVFFCTDASRTARQVIECYARCWGIEVLFRDLKQLLGFSSSRARSPLAVLRTAPWVAMCYTLLVLWHMEVGLDTSQMGLPIRPWYRTKHTVSFADILRLAQRTLASTDWVNPHLLLASLNEPTSRPQPKSA